MRILVVVVCLALAGCSGPPTEPAQRIHEVELTIEDLEDGVALLEVVLDEDGHVMVNMEPQLRRDEGLGGHDATLREGRDLCFGTQIGMSSRFHIAFGLGGSLETRVAGEDARVAWGPWEEKETQALKHDAPVSAGQPTYVVVALRDAETFASEGGELAIQVRADQPMQARRVDGAAFQCMVRPGDYDHGTYVDTGIYRQASDMEKTWDIRGQGTAFMWSSHAQGSYDVEMRRGAEVLKAHRSDQLGYAYSYTGFQLPAGSYKIAVNELSGLASPAWLTFAIGHVLDLPVSDSATPE